MEPSPARRPRFSGRTWRIAIPAGTFILGAVIGAAGSGSGGSAPTAAPAATSTMTTTETATATVTDSPQPKAGQVLLKHSGSGSWNSPPFTITPGSQLKVVYSFAANALDGQPSNFIADISSANDDQSIANTIAVNGSDQTSIYPDPVTGDTSYHLSVQADGSWTFTITEAG